MSQTPSPTQPVWVIGLDGGPLTQAAVSILGGVSLVAGGTRHLEAVAATLGAKTRQQAMGPLPPALEAVTQAWQSGEPVAVLASGDPGFFGIVRALREAGLPVQVVPATSSIAAAFARAGLPWDGAAVVSAHGRELRTALNACRALPLVAVLTAPGAGAAELAAGLQGWDRRLIVAENLGEPGEQVTEVSLAEAAGRDWSPLHVVLSVAPNALAGRRADNQPAAPPATGWALPESAFEFRDSMITKAEVRAWALSRLRPRLGQLIWDVGAGSGSVGLECARLGAAVVAIERDPEACAAIARNAATHQVDVRVAEGAAPQILQGLPQPDAVFIGGGGIAVVEAVAARPPAAGPDRIVVTLAAIDRVGPVLQTLQGHGFHTQGIQLSVSRFADLPDGGVRLAALNPVWVISAERGGEPESPTRSGRPSDVRPSEVPPSETLHPETEVGA